jgi:mannosyl-oligosaccharide glucosidase
MHSNRGKYVKHFVVKCGKADGSDPVEHLVPPSALQQGADPAKRCPATHPRFLFPLGDGGQPDGMMKREKMIAPAGDLKDQFVEHIGYVRTSTL